MKKIIVGGLVAVSALVGCAVETAPTSGPEPVATKGSTLVFVSAGDRATHAALADGSLDLAQAIARHDGEGDAKLTEDMEAWSMKLTNDRASYSPMPMSSVHDELSRAPALEGNTTEMKGVTCYRCHTGKDGEIVCFEVPCKF